MRRKSFRRKKQKKILFFLKKKPIFDFWLSIKHFKCGLTTFSRMTLTRTTLIRMTNHRWLKLREIVRLGQFYYMAMMESYWHLGMPWSVGIQDGLIRILQRYILKVHLHLRRKSVKNAATTSNFEEKLDKTQWTVYLWIKNVGKRSKNAQKVRFWCKVW